MSGEGENMLKELFRAISPQGEDTLTKFFSGIQEEKILWYPASGGDFRDILEFSPERMEKHALGEAPNIFFHSDYMYYHEMNLIENLKVLIDDRKTKITVLEIHPLIWRNPRAYRYSINFDFTGFHTSEPKFKVHFLKLLIESNMLATREVCLFYFHLENFHFLEDVILKNNFKIHTLVKTNTGMGFGGGKICISPVYQYLANLEVKYLLTDHMFHWSREGQERIGNAFRTKPKEFYLKKLYELSWNGGTGIFQVHPGEHRLTLQQFEESLQIITKGDEPWQSYVTLFPLDEYLRP